MSDNPFARRLAIVGMIEGSDLPESERDRMIETFAQVIVARATPHVARHRAPSWSGRVGPCGEALAAADPDYRPAHRREKRTP